MRSFCWSCVLGLLCVAAGVLGSSSGLKFRATSSVVRVNSSSEITCSTSLADPLGVYLKRSFQFQPTVLFLSLVNGRISRETTLAEFQGRVLITPQRSGFRLQLSRLGLGDTDLYYCQWTFIEAGASEAHTVVSDANLIIVQEGDTEEQCLGRAFNPILAGVSVAVLIAIILVAAVAIVRHRQVKRNFRPQRCRHDRPPPVSPRQRLEIQPYLVTSLRAPNSTVKVSSPPHPG